MRDYLLGLATLPALAAGGVALYYGGKAIAAATVKAFRGLPLSRPRNRAMFAAAAASSRRVHTIGFGAVSLVLTLGYDPKQFKEIYNAVYSVIAPKATINPKWLRRGTPTDSSLVAAFEIVEQQQQDAEPGYREAIHALDYREAVRLLEYALQLRQHGERAPGGNETWQQFDRDAEAYLRTQNENDLAAREPQGGEQR